MSLETEKIKILHLEEINKDIEQVECILKKSALQCEIRVVKTQIDYRKSLKTFTPDIVIGRSLVSFNSIKAMDIARRLGLKIPFIVIAGPASEEYAIDALNMGAYDYILTDRYLRLPFAIKSAIQRKEMEKKLANKLIIQSENEKKFDNLIQTFPASIVLLDKQGRITKVNSLWKAFADENGYRHDNYGIGLNYLEVTEKASKLDPSITNTAKSLKSLINGEISSFSEIYPCDYMDKKMWFRIIGTRNFEYEDMAIVIMHYDISDRMLIEEERLKINNELIRNTKNLEQFAYIVSHNLRAPVANIIGITDALSSDNISSKEENELKNHLKTSSSKLDEVIRDLNEILKIKKNTNARKEFVNLTSLTQDIKQSINHIINKEDVKFNFDFSEVEEIHTIKSYMHSILYNLISNSIKYRQADVQPIIDIKTVKKENTIEIIFRDNGMGIDLNNGGNHLFGLYKRFHFHTEGKGLGLFMVKTQLDVLAGNITVKSEINKGTEFRIELNSKIHEKFKASPQLN